MDVLYTLSEEQFNSLCRFCTKKQQNLKPIFKEENNDGFDDFTNSFDDNGIVNMLVLCTGIETTLTDGLPLFICTECYQKLIDSHSFRNQCIESVDRLRKIREIINNVKTEEDEPIDQNNSFFGETFVRDDGGGWHHDQEEIENYEEQKLDNCQVVVDPLTVNTDQSSSKKKSPTTKRKPSAKRAIKVTAKRNRKSEDTEIVNNVKAEGPESTTLNSSTASMSFDETKPEIDPVTGEIVTPSLSTDVPEVKQKHKRDLTKGPTVKKVRKPYVQKPNNPEQCVVCGFITRSLKSHMIVHTQERNFECDFCGKKFARRASLKDHIFTHIKIRPRLSQSQPMTIEEKQLAIQLHVEGSNRSSIARQLNRHRGTISALINAWKKGTFLTIRQRKKRRFKLTDQQVSEVLNYFINNPFNTYSQCIKELKLFISTRTIGKVLSRNGFRNRNLRSSIDTGQLSGRVMVKRKAHER